MIGDSREEVWPPIEKGRAAPGADRLGMWLFLVSLGIPFLVVIGAYFVLKASSPVWVPPELDGVPAILWASTAALLLVSAFSHRSVTSIRIDRVAQTKRALSGASVCVAIFTLCQVLAWEEMRVAFIDLDDDLRQYKVGFYLLTGFHALHVVGGMVLQVCVFANFLRGRYWSLHHPGIRYAAWYWHFLDALWIAIFVALLWGG